jgi:hypothetical protein
MIGDDHMTDIYDQHRAAFANVSAYVVLNSKGERIATVAFKYPRVGAGRLYAYVHWLGLPMVRGFASGGGYDKHSAAVASAAYLINRNDLPDSEPLAAFLKATRADDGHSWDRRLLDAGFTVIQAV